MRVYIANADNSFKGSVVLGMGFTFDDTDTKGVASPLLEMQRLIAINPSNAKCIFPYIGGEEINTSPTQAHHRFVINFGEMSENEARRWPDLLKIVEDKVKPDRMDDKRGVRKKYWWRFGETAPALYRSIATLKRVLARSQVSSHHAFVFLENKYVYDQRLVIFPLDTFAAFAALQATVHEIWSRFMGSTLKDDLVYAPSDCFEVFPFPIDFEIDQRFEAAGKAYYEFRARLMIQNYEGLTKTYNRFNDPAETSPDIKSLRELHAAMDRAILDAYGWTDLQTRCEFLLDYEEEGAEDDSSTSRRKKPWRYRWPDEFRDEVLARLLELNKQRAEEERLAGIEAEAATAKSGKNAPTKKKRSKDAAETPRLTGI